MHRKKQQQQQQHIKYNAKCQIFISVVALGEKKNTTQIYVKYNNIKSPFNY